MKYVTDGEDWLIRLDPGEEIVESITNFLGETHLKAGVISGIGSLNKLVLGYFEPVEKEYYTRELDGVFEITNLSGNITLMDGEPYLHLHVTVSDTEYKAMGGHLDQGIVSATAEITVRETKIKTNRIKHPEIGLNTLDL